MCRLNPLCLSFNPQICRLIFNFGWLEYPLCYLNLNLCLLDSNSIQFVKTVLFIAYILILGDFWFVFVKFQLLLVIVKPFSPPIRISLSMAVPKVSYLQEGLTLTLRAHARDKGSSFSSQWWKHWRARPWLFERRKPDKGRVQGRSFDTFIDSEWKPLRTQELEESGAQICSKILLIMLFDEQNLSRILSVFYFTPAPPYTRATMPSLCSSLRRSCDVCQDSPWFKKKMICKARGYLLKPLRASGPFSWHHSRCFSEIPLILMSLMSWNKSNPNVWCWNPL